MRTRIAVAASAAVFLAGCASSGPYTAASAAINTGLALGVSAHERAQGGCYAVCTSGTVCNPKTGYCEREKPAPCIRGLPGCEQGVTAPLEVDQLFANPDAAAAGPAGVSPATGRAPPPPPAMTTPDAR